MPPVESDEEDYDENRDRRKKWFGSSLPEYNILLLGETGAGKSTTINAFANYLKYEKFDEAKANRFVQLIYSKFTLPDPESGETVLIESGRPEENEKPGEGASSTQGPVAYTFKFKDRIMRIIDTPGMGDTSGASVDQQNFDKILAHLHNYNQLHGICILIKSSETRKTTFFRYCINELLAHLHKSACRNLVFCFTFSRNSFYGPGEGFSTLKGFLDKELKDVDMKLVPGENCFFIDNEAYRFLVALKEGYDFDENQENSFRDSWDRSVDQSNKMWDRIINIKPHQLKSTASLNNARKLIFELAEPMVRLQATIQTNIAAIKAKEAEVANSTKSKEELAKNLNLQVVNVEMKQLPYPRTVCTSERCTEIVNYKGKGEVSYQKHCHEHCYLPNATMNTIGLPILKHCAAIWKGDNCGICNCPYTIHMHVRVEYIKTTTTKIDQSKVDEIKNTEDAIKIINDKIADMKTYAKEFEDEYKVIQDISSKFAYLLINNSTTPYNKYLEPYLDLLMDEELKKIHNIQNYPRDEYENLKKMKESHQENVRILTHAIQSKTTEKVTLDDIFKYKDTLCNLKHSGAQFAQMLQKASWTKDDEHVKVEEKDKRHHTLDLSKPIKRKFVPAQETAQEESWFGKILNKFL